MWDTIRGTLRPLRRDPVLIATATVTLAVAIGANTTVFSVVDSVLLRPLPFPAPSHLYYMAERSGRNAMEAGLGPDYYSLREKKHVFEEVGTYLPMTYNWAGVDRPEQLDGVQASPSFFTTLGTKPMLGRTFDEAEQGAKAPQAVVISYAFWRSRLSSDPKVLSRTLSLDGTAYNVIGVMPRGFDYPKGTQVWMPLPMDEPSQRPRTFTRPILLVNIIARSKAGLTDEQVQQLMPDVETSIAHEYPKEFWKVGSISIKAQPLQQRITGDIRPALLVLLGAVGLVLLIACVNLANLLLARASARSREFAVRMALGSGKGALMRRLLAESCALALPGGVVGVLLSLAAVRLLNVFQPLVLANYPEIVLDVRTLAFTFVLTMFTGVLFGMAPAIGAARVDLIESLKSSGLAQSASRGARRARQLLVVAELAVSLVLLIGAGLLGRSFLNLAHVNLGFPSTNLLTLRVNLTGARYATGPAQQAYYHDVVERLQRLPGVTNAAVTTDLPLTGERPYQGMVFDVAGRTPLPAAQRSETAINIVSPEFFQTLGVPLRAGRTFDSSDTAGSYDAIVVNEAFARNVFPGEDPVGHQTVQGRPENRTKWTIVGVVGDIRAGDLGAEPKMVAYRCICQLREDRFLTQLRVMVRTAADPRLLRRVVETAMYAVDREQPVFDVKTMDERIDAALAPERFYLLLIGGFAAIAIVLAGLGVYGVMAYLVTRRTREIGIRIAIGAEPAQVQRLVLRETAWLALIAVLAGIGGAYGLTRYLKTMLYGVTEVDVATFAIAPVLLAIVAIGASIIPARRAATVDPITALREE